MEGHTMFTFLSASILLSLSPGPDNLFVLALSAVYGKGAGIIVVLGLCTGLLIHTAAVALGLAAVFQTSVIAFTALKYLGAAYLLFLAYQSFRSKSRGPESSSIPKLSPAQLYRRGILMNMTNPKVSIFFLAFLPQFTDPGKDSVAIQIITLGVLFILCAMAVFGLIAYTAGSFGAKIGESIRIHLIMHRIAGGVFFLLAIKLLVGNG